MDVTLDTVRVLLVDDQAAFRSAARLVVDMADGFEVVAEAASAEEGLEQAAALRPDLVLMDVNLPGMNGLDATRRLSAGGGPAVIVLSTYSADEYAGAAAAAGAIAFISKSDFDPFTLDAAWQSARG